MSLMINHCIAQKFSSYVAHLRIQPTTDHMTRVLAVSGLATNHDIQFQPPLSMRRLLIRIPRDLLACLDGLARPNPRLNFGLRTLPVIDIEFGHTYTSSG